MTLRRRTALVVLTAACAATAVGPALAADGPNSVPVTASTVGGTRQFDVLKADGTGPLDAVNLTTTGSQAFKTRVKDSNFDTLTKSYSATATMSNLYLRKGDGTYDVATKIPSGQLSIGHGALTADDLTATLLPQISVSGTLAACDKLPDSVKNALGIPLTSTLATLLTTLTGPVLTLCTELGSNGAAVTGTVDGVLATVQATVADVTKLPNALTKGVNGSFTNADYSHDARAQTDGARTGAPAPTGIALMNGAAASTLPSELSTALLDSLSTALATTPLTREDDTAARTTVSRVNAVVGSSATTALGTAAAGLTALQQSALYNTLSSTPLAPVLSTVKNITSNYYANPTLNATLSAPVPGVYDGTMTITFVQS